MARHLLIIAYAFPPNSAVGAMRPLRLVKSLAASGRWRTTVLAVGGPVRRRDDRLAEEVPAGTAVHRVPTFEPLRLLERNRTAAAAPKVGVAATDNPAATVPPPPAGSGPRAWLRDLLSTPDTELFWVAPVVERALRLHLQRRFDAVLVTSPPWSAQVAGAVLSRLLRIPWIADYRDPWTDIDRGQRAPAFERWNRRIENTVLPHAAGVVSTSDTYTDLLRARFPQGDPERFATIYNGFDEAKIKAHPRPGRRRLTLVHLGTIYEIWRPWKIFAVLSEWLRQHPERRSEVVLRFVGQPGRRTRAALTQHGLDDVVEITGFVEHADAIAACQEADALLLALGSDPGVPRGWLPSKLFEYIAYQRPILANVAAGEAQRLISGAGAGWAAADHEPQVLTAALDDLWRRKQEAPDGRIPWTNRLEPVADLTQARLVTRWEALLDASLRRSGR